MLTILFLFIGCGQEESSSNNPSSQQDDVPHHIAVMKRVKNCDEYLAVQKDLITDGYNAMKVKDAAERDKKIQQTYKRDQDIQGIVAQLKADGILDKDCFDKATINKMKTIAELNGKPMPESEIKRAQQLLQMDSK